MLFGVYKAPEPLMSSDPNKRKHFRYLTVFSLSSRLLFQNFRPNSETLLDCFVKSGYCG